VPKDPIVAVSVASAICFVCEAIDSLREGGAEIDARSIRIVECRNSTELMFG